MKSIRFQAWFITKRTRLVYNEISMVCSKTFLAWIITKPLALDFVNLENELLIAFRA